MFVFVISKMKQKLALNRKGHKEVYSNLVGRLESHSCLGVQNLCKPFITKRLHTA